MKLPTGLNPFVFRSAFVQRSLAEANVRLSQSLRIQVSIRTKRGFCMEILRVSIPSYSGQHSYKAGKEVCKVASSLNPFVFRSAFVLIHNSAATGHATRLNPFVFRSAFVRKGGSQDCSNFSLNPFVFRSAFVHFTWLGGLVK